MTSGVLRQILDDVESGNFRVSVHAQKRMHQRNISKADIENVAKTVKNAEEQEPEKFKLIGEDLDGDELTVVCAVDGDTIVVTVY